MKNATLILSLLLPLITFATDLSIIRYLSLYEKYPTAFEAKGDWKAEEIELVLDAHVMQQLQDQFQEPIGVVAEDRFWIWIRDAIILPTGKYSTYNRFISKKGLEGPAGVVVLATTPKEEILINVIFRHATRNFEIELPRGGKNFAETYEAAASREVQEETGFVIKELYYLGTIATDSGILSNFLKVYFARIDQQESTNRDEEEVIADTILLPKQTIDKLFCEGKLELFIHGEKKLVFCRDPFFAYALLLAEKMGYIPK